MVICNFSLVCLLVLFCMALYYIRSLVGAMSQNALSHPLLPQIFLQLLESLMKEYLQTMLCPTYLLLA